MGKSFSNPVGAVTNVATGGLVGYNDGHFGAGVVSGLADNATGGAISKGINGIGDAILGKKDPGQAAQNLDFRTDQEKALQGSLYGQYGNILNEDTSKLAANQTANLENQARSNAEDQTREAQKMVAQRGLGNTSLGLNAILNQKSNLGNQIGAIHANQPMLENQMRKDNLNFASNGINSTLNSRMNAFAYQPAVASKGRQGGLAPLLGGAAGAYFGGPAGAQVGMGLGQAATQIG